MIGLDDEENENISGMSSDSSTQRSALDALSCKYSAYRQGYFQDTFIRFFCNKISDRKSPIINKGELKKENHTFFKLIL